MPGYLGGARSTQQQNVGASRTESFNDASDTARAGFLAAGRTVSWGPATAGNPHTMVPAGETGHNPWQGSRDTPPDQG
jgi:hypothetical protein